jgi:2,4-dienoyl-CoA reductase-like NADH-dependent reductase (Old Yellow Enzyme family)
MLMKRMPSLLDPLKIGSLKLKNRIVMPPMYTGYANNNDYVTEKLKKHYTDRASALGLLIVEHSFVVLHGKARMNQPGVYSDDFIPGLKRLVKAVHEKGTPIAIQLGHGGGTSSTQVTGFRPVAPSPILHPHRGVEIPRQLSLDEIEGVIDCFRDAAQRGFEAGFDAVEIHGAHGYLLGQFHSPVTNKRLDEYGGRLENRVRLSCRIVEEVKKDLGTTFPVLFRIGIEDLAKYPGGLTLQEGVEAAKMIVEAGVDVIDVSGGLGGSMPEGLRGPGFFVPHAGATKKVVDIPVIGVGGIKTAEEAEKIIRSGRVDLVAVGRAILNEPNWAKNAVRKLEFKI